VKPRKTAVLQRNDRPTIFARYASANFASAKQHAPGVLPNFTMSNNTLLHKRFFGPRALPGRRAPPQRSRVHRRRTPA